MLFQFYWGSTVTVAAPVIACFILSSCAPAIMSSSDESDGAASYRKQKFGGKIRIWDSFSSEFQSKLNEKKLLIFLHSKKPTAEDDEYVIRNTDDEEAKAEKEAALEDAIAQWEEATRNIYWALAGRLCKGALDTVKVYEDDGIAAWNALVAEMEQEGLVRKSLLRRKLDSVTFTPGGNPAETFKVVDNCVRELACIGDTTYSSEFMLEKLMAQLQILPEYEAVWAVLDAKMQTGDLTYKQFKDSLVHNYGMRKAARTQPRADTKSHTRDLDDRDEDKPETALGGFGDQQRQRPDTRICNHCGVRGHIWKFCRVRLAEEKAKKGGHSGGHGPCPICGDPHDVGSCPELSQAVVTYRKARDSGPRAAAAPKLSKASKLKAHIADLVTKTVAEQVESHHKAHTVATKRQKGVKTKSGFALLVSDQVVAGSAANSEIFKGFEMSALTSPFKAVLVVLVLLLLYGSRLFRFFQGPMAMAGFTQGMAVPVTVDTGATLTIFPSCDGLGKVEPRVTKIGTAKAGVSLVSTHVGILRASVLTDQGQKVPLVLKEVHVVPELEQPLLSVDALNASGCSVRFEPKPVGAYLLRSGHRIPLVSAGGLRQLHLYPPCEASDQAHAAVSSILIHRRCGHRRMEDIRWLGEQGVGGIPRNLRLRSKCGVCQTCKHKRVSFQQPLHRDIVAQPLEESCMDLGEVTVPSQGGKRWYMICTDRATRYRFIYYLSRKSQVAARVVDLHRDILSLGGQLKRIKCDSGGEFIAASVVNWGKEQGIRILPGGPHAPEQNGIAERSNGIVFQMAATLRKTAGLPPEFWVPAMTHAIYLLNRMPTTALNRDTPYHALRGTHADLSHLKVFGSRCWFHVHGGKKTDDLAIEGIYVGCDENNPRRARIMYLDAKRGWQIRQTVHYTIDENVFPGRSPTFGQLNITHALDSEVLSDSDSDSSDDDSVVASPPARPVGDGMDGMGADGPLGGDDSSSESEIDEASHGDGSGEDSGSGEDGSGSDDDDGDSGLDEALDDDGSDEEEATRPTRGNTRLCTIEGCQHDPTNPYGRHLAHCVRLPQHFAFAAYENISAMEKEPNSFKEAMASPHAEFWLEATVEEMGAHRARQTWELIPYEPGMHVLRCRWVYKYKRDHTGNVVRYKARLVIQGFGQKFGIDFFDTFAPVARMSSIRLVLAIAAVLDLILHQLDIVTAFLEADVEEVIIMSQPEGFVEVGPNGERMVCRLRKSLYGLKQAPRNWNKELDSFLRKLGFEPSSVDPCIYIKSDSSGGIMLVALYVDDLVLAASNMTLIDDFKAAIGDRFHVKDLGELRWVLGIEVKRDRANRTVELVQSAFVDQFLERFGMSNCKPVATPAVGVLPRLTAESGGVTDVDYMSKVGAGLWLAMGTRPDIAYTVQTLGRHMNAVGPEHHEACKRMMRYLKGTRDLGIKYTGNKDNTLEVTVVADNGRQDNPVEVSLHADSSWGDDPATRRSTTGFLVMMAGAAVNWSSKLQQTVALSTSEAEYMAACAAAQEAIFQRQLLEDMGFPQKGPTVIYEDNTGAIAMSENPVSHNRTKHIDIKYHFVRERVELGEIKLVHVATENQLADLLTKSLAKVKHERLRERVMGHK